MRCSLTVCCLLASLSVGCSTGGTPDGHESQWPEVNAGDVAQGPQIEVDPRVQLDAGGPLVPTSPDAPIRYDAGGMADTCSSAFRIVDSCVTLAVVRQRADELCERQGWALETSESSVCPGLVSDAWLRCCPSWQPPHVAYDAGVGEPIACDAGAPPPSTIRECALILIGDGHSCVESDELDWQARQACAAGSGQLTSLLLQGGDCAGGASSAQATCCVALAVPLH